jgi:hypothetical protein
VQEAEAFDGPIVRIGRDGGLEEDVDHEFPCGRRRGSRADSARAERRC